ncbi:MAG: hypothetical protein HY078_12585 [Elusimicrobia bacterium]|nr:hypothetical protein [Elusimicrobiota bacterium]
MVETVPKAVTPLSEIVPSVWRWTWFSEEKGMNFNGYAARLPGGLAIIDPAYAEEPVWRAIEELGTPAKILLTNKDHERASAELRERWKVPVAIHEAEAPLLSFNPDETFGDGASVLGLTAVRMTRMKSPAECAFLWPERRVLFIGDAVTGHPAGRLGLVKKHVGRPEVFADLQALSALDFYAIFMGDGEPMFTGAKEALGRLVAEAK